MSDIDHLDFPMPDDIQHELDAASGGQVYDWQRVGWATIEDRAEPAPTRTTLRHYALLAVIGVAVYLAVVVALTYVAALLLGLDP